MLLTPGYSLCLVPVVILREKEYVCVDCCAVEDLDAAEVKKQLGIGFLGKKLTEIFTISGPHPFVGCYIAKMASVLQHAPSLFIEQAVYVPSAGK